jgi:alanyl-tRNA synthetase
MAQSLPRPFFKRCRTPKWPDDKGNLGGYKVVMKNLSDIRTGFLEFFRERGHAIVPSSPLVPRNDPTLLFTNAGMVQFKNVFTGAEKRPYSRATTVQKCVRAGGKHNDLDNVGYTARHHTFFEMLGNFSFGDYFKEDAIAFAWDFVTKTVGLPKDKLWITVYTEDEQARALWKKIAGVSEDRIVGHPSNLWAMGPVGPCGYCSEIFYDQGENVAGGPPGSPDEDGDRYLEFWNLVFMQFEQIDENTRRDLPRPSIDTGLGLERLAAILQGVTNNYDTDLFRHLIAASEQYSGAKSEGSVVASHRIITDHLRSSAFLIADGVLPSNEGRGYVLRRIMRRAMRHAHLIGSKEPLMHRLVPSLVAEMGSAYPELTRAEALIDETLKLEETRFRETLARGLKLLDEATTGMSRNDSLAGEIAFKLYDTYGFPLDLTEDALKARGIKVDTAGFNAAMAKQRADARKAWAGSGDAATETAWFSLVDEFGKTEFLGYDTEEAEGTVLAVIKDGKKVAIAKAGETVRVLTNQTPFYGLSGGQVGDIGMMKSARVEARVIDTEKKLGLHIHVVEIVTGELLPGDSVDLIVDRERRAATRANHSATHLLQASLKRVLGNHVAQKGSSVDADRLRFDFSHPKPVSDAELRQVEALVNDVVRQNGDVATRLMPTDKAIKLGAEALFGEKYGEEVRVLTMGRDVAADKPYSVELCGGTHVARLGDIGLFTVLSESAVASGVRRIEALTRGGAFAYLKHQEDIVRKAAAAIKVNADDLPARVDQLHEEHRKLERELADAKKALALAGPSQSGGASDVQEIAGVKAVLKVVDGVNAKDLKGLADDAKAQLGSGVAAFVAVDGGKASVVVGVPADLTAKLSAVDLVRAAAAALGGKGGGGRPDMAQAGGPDGTRADEALKAVAALIAKG